MQALQSPCATLVIKCVTSLAAKSSNQKDPPGDTVLLSGSTISMRMLDLLYTRSPLILMARAIREAAHQIERYCLQSHTISLSLRVAALEGIRHLKMKGMGFDPSSRSQLRVHRPSKIKGIV